ncbi:lysine N(6)-hydroxylase/L-ornithine N(5)-oxygenase family protein [Actinomadura sp. NAK00032]|uniref:lysine N(6)-hydroxylase/L-ornithine N(5)-oxygenase family protein n=1 Tax=Actinomadura sp. NAK00032 TaxID=2742128 RepID=UPI0020C7D93A|nr:SidA/IucD/PvdA family monooxygenase [Actinomadura sp. NAK00032]
MDEPATGTYDVVGVGFGPANLSLAIALDECPEPVTAAFFERQASLGWHRGMLVPSAKMQVSFLKDLVTFRNPASPYGFVSYLHESGRLPRFVNNGDFFPTRREFHDYLEWAEAKLRPRVHYGAEVTAVRIPPGTRGPADRLLADVRDPGAPGGVRAVAARNLVVSTGLVPRMPAGVEPDESVWHSSQFLGRFRDRDPARLRRVAVAGAGQSAAEIVRFLYDTLPDAVIHAIVPSYGYSIADSTPFANQVFDPEAIDDYYHGSRRAQDAFWEYHKNTNYSVVDDEVIRDLYRRAYDDGLAGTGRLNFLPLSRVAGVKSVVNDTRVTVYSTAREDSRDLDVDVLVCATGYDPMDPADVLGELDAHCLHEADGRIRVGRDWRIATAPGLRCGIYLQGGTEHTHGLSSSLLSNLATRSGEITRSIVAGLAAERGNGVRA